MITAIITKLKTGSIPDVFPRGTVTVNPDKPYVVVWEDTPLAQPGRIAQGIALFFVSVHFPKGDPNGVEDYIYTEACTLLDGQTLTDRFGNLLEVSAEMDISPLTDTNDDGTLSRDRQFSTVRM